ncbi:hypothetical protein BC829DRAFT_184217 [Chytridium lagenaria]|nr:hypothetical protein BC829DRAFT_184217 [Chytridium lagenaria]
MEYLLPGRIRTPTWYNTVASSLSTHPKIFQSGSELFKVPGWWALIDNSPPPPPNTQAAGNKKSDTKKRSQAPTKDPSSKKIRGWDQKMRRTTLIVSMPAVKAEPVMPKKSSTVKKVAKAFNEDDVEVNDTYRRWLRGQCLGITSGELSSHHQNGKCLIRKWQISKRLVYRK